MNIPSAAPSLPATPAAPATIRVSDGRFARFEQIEWWDQALLTRSRILVIGAGALGNEVIKNLALLGIGHLAIVDMDSVELSNLSRSVLFRESDEGLFKADRAALAARDIFPGMETIPLVENVLTGLGLGWFRWADVVIGALDNREARVFVNSACAQVGRPWVDGGIEALHGIARVFAPPKTACYECTMSKVDWDLINKRRSCSLLARRALAHSGTPTTPTTASVIGAVQVQETLKLIHRRNTLLGQGFIFDGAGHSSYTTNYSIDPDCPWHEVPPQVESLAQFDSDTKLSVLWQFATDRMGGLDVIDFTREIVERLECATCGTSEDVLQAADEIEARRLICPKCDKEAAPVFLHSVGPADALLLKSCREIGLPAWDILWARHDDKIIGLELSGDNPCTRKPQR